MSGTTAGVDLSALSKIAAAHKTPEVAPPASVESKTFYSRLDGNTYYTKTGHCCRFENGQYEAKTKEEIDELNALCKLPGQFLISDEPLPVHYDPDVKILKEVGQGKSTSITGTVNSQHIGNVR